MAAIMNSSIVALFTELSGRLTLGDGALELSVEDARDYLCVPDIRGFDHASREAITAAFHPLLKRPIGNVFEEITKPDRQALDQAVFSAMGQDPEAWLPRIYDGLTTLVRERMELGKMRSQSRKSKPKKAAFRIREEVLQELMPEGTPEFPASFLSQAALNSKFREIPIFDEPYQYKGYFMGKEEMTSSSGRTIQLANPYEVRYILYAQNSGQQVIRLPENPLEVTRTVNNYLRYLKELRKQLYDSFFTRTLEQSIAERFVSEVWKKYHLPEIEE
jgi:hypothetical protein